MIFNNVDKKFEKIGFKKIEDTKYCVRYEWFDEDFKYTHVLAICHKASGRHIVQSYDKYLMDAGFTGNVCIGLTYYEMKLALRKMKQKGWKSK
jgi:hypothetical protein